MSKRFAFIIPDDTSLFDVLNALVYFGRPVIETKEVKGGFQIAVMSSAQDMAAYRAYVTRMGWNGAPVLAENKPAAPAPATEQPPNTTTVLRRLEHPEAAQGASACR